MKGYSVNAGYYGWIPSEGRYILFATEGDYEELYLELERSNDED